jgi:putative SOS response-associated peptidase YedK
MCNAYRLKTGAAEIADLFSAIGMPLRFKDGLTPNLKLWQVTRPNIMLPIIRPQIPAAPAAGLELVETRWNMIPFFHTGGMERWRPLCTNAKSETIAIKPTYREPYKRRRCLVPADGYFEWTGEKRAKTRWLFERVDGAMWCFPGVWDSWPGPNGQVESFALLTTSSGPDLAPYQNRQPVILEPDRWGEWLDLSQAPAATYLGSRSGTLKVTRAPAEPISSNEAAGV